MPLTLGKHGETKLPVAVTQARALGATVILLHVIPGPRRAGKTVDPHEALARTYLEMVAAGMGAEGLGARIVVRHGPVARVILDEIVTQRVDLVVIGTDTSPGLKKALLGSIAQQVVASAVCPVLLVKPDPPGGGKERSVRSFNEDLERVGEVFPHNLGLRMVDPARIVGSVGRADEMDTSLRVRKAARPERERYQRILSAMEQGESLPTVVLYKLGYGYYVVEGHRRVAAARELGHTEIAAEVTDFVPVRDPLRRQVFAERREFEAATGLTRLGVAGAGNYPRLEEMIRQFAEREGSGSLREAAQAWDAIVYSPVAQLIREMELNRHSPDMRTGDLFLMAWTFRAEESSREGRDLGWEETLKRLLSELPPSSRPGSRLGGVKFRVLGR